MKRFLRTALVFVRFLFLILLSLAVTMEQEHRMRENYTNVTIPFRLLHEDVCPLIRDILYETTYDFQIHCAMKCVKDPFCAGYNFKEKQKNIPNCQLTHTLDHNFHDCNADDKDWIFYRPLAPRKSQIPCHKKKNCKNGEKTIIYLKDGSDPFRCECPNGYIGDLCQNATSCSSLLIKHPSTPSGKYDINPQGFNSSSAVQVYCDMTSKNGVGVTVIGHDSESRTLVNGYEQPGSYKRKIKYDISMEQIVAIMNQSKNCEQFIKYECYFSVLFYGSHAWWVSRQGSQMNYWGRWGETAVNSGKCACGMTNSCAASGYKCNCDTNDETWREDSGYLTEKNTLPVTELRFGDTGASFEKGYHTLGKLQCWG